MTAKNNYTYEKAFKELQEIVQKIEIGDVDIDKLSDYIKRATNLVKICEAKLTQTEEEVQILLQKLNEEDATEENAKVEEENMEDYDTIDEDTDNLIEEENNAKNSKDSVDTEAKEEEEEEEEENNNSNESSDDSNLGVPE